MNTRMNVRRVGLESLGKMGCLLGTVAALVPSLVCGLLFTALAGLMQRWLEGWQEVNISLLGNEIMSLDLIELLHLNQVLDALQVVTAASAVTVVLAVLALALVSGVLLAMIIILVGLAYNFLASLTGGVVVDLVPSPTTETETPRRTEK